MPKNFLLTKKSQGQKKKRFDSLTAKKVLLLILILAVFLFGNIESVLAATIEPGLNEIASPLGLGTMDIRVTIAQIIRVALGMLGIVAVVIILYGGFLYMTSMGEATKIQKAKDVIRDGIIGLIIILMAFAIASFIINAIMQSIYGPISGVPPNYGDGGGALGNGIIESHYPARNAVDVPRNTSIIVTFKVPMSVASIVNDVNNNDNVTPIDFSDDRIAVDGSNVPVVKIHKTGDTVNVTKVRVSYTSDLKTFVFKPLELLGSPDQPLNYTVELTNNIKKFDGTSAFGSFGGYKWSFDVSTRTDLTPPQIESVIPKPENESKNSVPRNMVIQINFNEAINPMTMQGKVEVTGGAGATVGQLLADTFSNINIYELPNSGSDKFIAGQFNYGNQYRTVEFVSNDLCGKNACGEDVFCLPSSQNIGVLIKAATLDGKGPSALFPYTGIVDMADNSLDGNKDGQAQGPSANPPYNFNDPTVIASRGDNAQWSFFTNDIIDLVPPQLETGYLPEAGATKFSPLASIIIPFDKLMMATSIKPDRGYGDGYCKCTTDTDCGCSIDPLSPQCDPANKCDLVHGTCLNKDQTQFVCTESIPKVLCPTSQACQEKHHLTLDQPITVSGYIPRGYWLSSQNNPEETKTTAQLDHYPLAEDMNYGIIAGSGLRDLMQNCYQPCSGPGCVRSPKSGGKPGEYQKGNPWSGTYPSCQMPPVSP